MGSHEGPSSEYSRMTKGDEAGIRNWLQPGPDNALPAWLARLLLDELDATRADFKTVRECVELVLRHATYGGPSQQFIRDRCREVLDGKPMFAGLELPAADAERVAQELSAQPAKWMSDEDLLGYLEILSRTERPLFKRNDILRLMALADAELICDLPPGDPHVQVHREGVQQLVRKARVLMSKTVDRLVASRVLKWAAGQYPEITEKIELLADLVAFGELDIPKSGRF